jgi:Ala-tRNA(Pro) deacylase
MENIQTVPFEQQKVFDRLKALGIPYEVVQHPAVFSIEEMDSLGVDFNGEICKNLFLRDAKGRRHFLVVLQKDKKADLKNLAQQLESTALSFASPERLFKYLGLHKGEVTPLGVLNDTEHAVEVFFDEDLAGLPRLGVHPNDNTATVMISYENLIKVIERNGHTVRTVRI